MMGKDFNYKMVDNKYIMSQINMIQILMHHTYYLL